MENLRQLAAAHLMAKSQGSGERSHCRISVIEAVIGLYFPNDCVSRKNMARRLL
jgi:hypothetical protein